MRTKFLLIVLLFLLPASGFSQLTSDQKELLRLELGKRINDLRTSLGLSALIFNDTLQKAAAFHSDYMAENDVLSHDEKKGKYAKPKDRVEAFKGKDFEIVGENVLFSTPQEFPLKKKDVIALADEMFNTWKNSPGHYANMTEPEYVYGDLGFKTNMTKRIVYATQVFGKKGIQVDEQLSNDAFGLKAAPADCDKAYEQYSNLILNMGNDLRIEGDEVMLYYHSIHWFQKLLSEPNDGIAVDFISQSQLDCGKPNQLDFSPVYDGILLKPYYRDDLIAGNRAESAYRVITKVADIPPSLHGKEFSPSVVLIKNGQACKYIFPAFVPRREYDLKPIDPIVKDEFGTELLEDGIIASQIVNYEFNTDKTTAKKKPEIARLNADIHSITIQSYSSVEGDSVHNAELHESRAKYIKQHVESILKVNDSLIKIDARENWEMMNFQLNYLAMEELLPLSHDSIKALLKAREKPSLWDSLLFDQRKSVAIINYKGTFNNEDADESLACFNLRTAVALDNPKLANKAMYVMHEQQNYDPFILFEPQIIEFIQRHPETVGNYSALLSYDYFIDAYGVTKFIHHWLTRKNEISSDAKSNLLHLYSLIGVYLLDKWDTSSERLSNVIHPLKVEKLSPKTIQDELMLNLHLTFIQYFGQVNDGPNISKSFYFIADYFKKASLKPDEDVDLALFFNNWSMYHMTVEHLSTKYKEGKLNEDGLFVLAETMNFTNYKDESGLYFEIQEKALAANKERWCNWITQDFQVKRNYQIKRLYCDSCN